MISGIFAGVVTVILLLLIVFIIIFKKPKLLNLIIISDKTNTEPDSEHIVFKKQKLHLLKQEMNTELKNKRKISGEFDKTAIKIKMDKSNQLVNQGI